MRFKFFFLFILTSMSLFAQTEFEEGSLKVLFDKNIDSKKMSIMFTQGSWDVTIFPLFENNQITTKTFPLKAGIYSLVINYSESLYHKEIVHFILESNIEKLSFEFYQNSGKMFCKVQSDFAELNKEIILVEESEAIKEMIKEEN